MKNRTRTLPALLLVAGHVLLAGCAGMEKRETAAQPAAVPPPPGTSSGPSAATPQETHTTPQDLPDRLFAPLDDTVNDINRDINRELDSEFPENKNKQPPTPDN